MSFSNATLTISTQPPPVFVNQQWGKRHGFHVIIQLHGFQTMTNSLVLKTELAYFDNNKTVPENSRSCSRRRKYKMLQILDQRNFDKKGEAEIFCRINDVSRNHQGRKFCLRFSCACEGKVLAQCSTTAIKVISKRPKRKINNNKIEDSVDTSNQGGCPSKRCRTGPCISKKFTKPSDWEQREWMAKSYLLLQHMQGQQVGFYDAAQTQPIFQCPICHGCSIPSSKLPVHNAGCVLASLLEQYQEPSRSCVDGDGSIEDKSKYSIMSPDSIMDSTIGCDLPEDDMLLDILDDEMANGVELNEDLRGVNGVIDRFLSAPFGSENFFE